jgi:hypothetical protein
VKPPLGISGLRNCEVRAVLEKEVKIKNCFLGQLKENLLPDFVFTIRNP